MAKRNASEFVPPHHSAANLARPAWVKPAPAWLRLLWKKPFVAITLPWAIYVRPEVFDYEPERLRRLIAHELVHVAQWRAGKVKFLRRYLAEYRTGRRSGMSAAEAYAAISYEVEARRAETDL